MKVISKNKKISKVKLLLQNEYIENFENTISLSSFINNLLLVQKKSEKENLGFEEVNEIINMLKKSKYEIIK